MKPLQSPTKTAFLVITLSVIGVLLAGSLFVLPGATSAQNLNAPAFQNTQATRFSLQSQVQATADLQILNQPASDGQPLGKMTAGQLAIVVGGPFNDGWYWLQYRDVRGYAPGEQLALPGQWKATPTAVPTKAASTPTSTIPVPPVVAPVTGSYAGLWLGELTRSTVVRSGPGSNTAARKSWWAGRRVLLYASARDAAGNTWYRVSETPEASMYVPATSVRAVAPVQFQSGRFAGRWVDVNLTQQVVSFYEGAVPVKATLASTGTAKHPTAPGTFHIYYRLTSQEMKGGSKATGDYYDLPNVPYPQYFYGANALHGTYWHDNFGRPMSHGCVNLSTPIATWLWGWASMGTTVYVHY